VVNLAVLVGIEDNDEKKFTNFLRRKVHTRENPGYGRHIRWALLSLESVQCHLQSPSSTGTVPWPIVVRALGTCGRPVEADLRCWQPKAETTGMQSSER